MRKYGKSIFLRKNGEGSKTAEKKILHNFKCDIEISECEKKTHRVTASHTHANTKININFY